MNKTLTVEHIAKVEGHGKLHIDIKKGEVKDVRMEIFEGARYFESLVKGRDYREVPAITSRICGICSQSHLLCAIIAMERAMDIQVTEQTQSLRELLMLASLIQSHVLHLYFLALPEYVGCDNSLELANTKYKKDLLRALKLKRFANDIVHTLGGREIHSITPVVGGFLRLPSQEALKDLLLQFKELKPEIEKTIKLFTNTVKYPKFSRDTKYLALRDKNKINYIAGELQTDNKIKFSQENYAKHIDETVLNYSNTKSVTLNETEFMVGSLARINVNQSLLSRATKQLIKKSKIKFPSNNPYHNNAAQAFELMDFFDKSIAILTQLKIDKTEEPVEYKVKSGRGVAIIEAPRGLLIHEYNLDAKGKVKSANIMAPTTLNMKNIEEDAKVLLTELLKTTKAEKTLLGETEKLIRAYDPCISCSTHFLKLKWNLLK